LRFSEQTSVRVRNHLGSRIVSAIVSLCGFLAFHFVEIGMAENAGAELAALKADMQAVKAELAALKADMQAVKAAARKRIPKRAGRSCASWEDPSRDGEPTAEDLTEVDAKEQDEEPLPDLSEALAIVADLARQALQDAVRRLPPQACFVTAKEQLGGAEAMLETGGQLTSRKTARCYDSVLGTRNLVHGIEKGSAKPVKDALRVVRELLALQCCAAALGASGAAFEAALIDAFERNLESELYSQMHLSRSSIVRLGRDRGAFDVAAPKLFGRSISDDDRAQLFAAYSAASGAGARSMRSARNRQRPPKTKPRQQMLATDPPGHEAARGFDMHPMPRSMRVGSLGDPMRVAPQQSGQAAGDGLMLGGDSMFADSMAPWQAAPKLWPPWRHSSISDGLMLGGDSVFADSMAPWQAAPECTNCGEEDAGCSPDRFGNPWCPKCLQI
jgi:hypothetical protein